LLTREGRFRTAVGSGREKSALQDSVGRFLKKVVWSGPTTIENFG